MPPQAASVPRMVAAPLARLARRVPGSNISASPKNLFTPLTLAVTAAVQRLDFSLNPKVTFGKIAKAKPTVPQIVQNAMLFGVWCYSLWMITAALWFKLFIVSAYTAAVLVPFTSQLIWPATPVLTWVLLFFSARYIPTSSRPGIHVALLPALESVMYGANISDLQTRFTHPVLDVLAWLPYGVLHFTLPVVVALVLWVFGPRGSAQYWGKAFGWMNVLGVMTQIILPCAAPWYELIHGLTPADYSMGGSPGGLLRIDRFFHSDGYANTFGSAPVVFGAFPSLHSGCAVMEALFLSHFFPFLKPLYWGYTGILWWATMYLSHHYLIDLTGGACLSVLVFFLFQPAEFKDIDGIRWSTTAGGDSAGEYEMLNGHPDVDFDEEIRRLEEEDGPRRVADEENRIDAPGSSSGAPAGGDIADAGAQQQARNKVRWGENQVLGEAAPAA